MRPRGRPRRNSLQPAPDGNAKDEVDDFVDQRHKVMLDKTQELSDSDDSEQEPEFKEVNVMDIEISDSEENSESEHDDLPIVNEELQERLGFGGRKRDWYGGDTHEYEIMEDEEREEALKEEEEEARRLQTEELSRMKPEDYRDDFEGSSAGESGDEMNKVTTDQPIDKATPEVRGLIREMTEAYHEMKVWKERVKEGWGEMARVSYHVHATFVTNVLCYLSLKTDKANEDVDLTTHPILSQIVDLRELRKTIKVLKSEAPARPDKKMPLVVDEVEEKQVNEKESWKKHVNIGLVDIDTIPKIGENGDLKEIVNSREEKDRTAEYDKNERKERRERKRKRRERRKKKKAEKEFLEKMKTDEENVLGLLEGGKAGVSDDEQEQKREQKRRKLNSLTVAIERGRKSKEDRQIASADADIVRKEHTSLKAPARLLEIDDSERADDVDTGDMDDDDDIMRKMMSKKAKKEARKARKEAEQKAHVYTFKDDVDPESRRMATSQVVKNRGLTRYRPRGKKTPRARNRAKFSKAVVRRKGAVQEYSGKPGAGYAGEASGINMSARKGSRLSNV